MQIILMPFSSSTEGTFACVDDKYIYYTENASKNGQSGLALMRLENKINVRQFMPTQRSESDAMFTSLICTSVSFNLRQEKDIYSIYARPLYMSSQRILISPGMVLVLFHDGRNTLASCFRFKNNMQEFMARKQTIVCVQQVHQSSLMLVPQKSS